MKSKKTRKIQRVVIDVKKLLKNISDLPVLSRQIIDSMIFQQFHGLPQRLIFSVLKAYNSRRDALV